MRHRQLTGRAGLRIDFARVTGALGLSRETLSSLAAFRSRHAQAKTSLASLKAQKLDVDWSFYRNTLKNQAVVDKLEKIWKDFKPQDYDVSAQLKAIDQFEGKAVRAVHRRPPPEHRHRLGLRLDAMLKRARVCECRSLLLKKLQRASEMNCPPSTRRSRT